MSQSTKAKNIKIAECSDEVSEEQILLIEDFVNKVGSFEKAKEALNTLTQIRKAA